MLNLGHNKYYEVRREEKAEDPEVEIRKHSLAWPRPQTEHSLCQQTTLHCKKGHSEKWKNIRILTFSRAAVPEHQPIGQ